MFNCNICQRSYKFKKTLNRHEKEAHNKAPGIPPKFCCNICKIYFNRKMDLKVHIKTHKKRQSRILCAIKDCKDKFMWYSNLHKHLIERHCLELTTKTHEFSKEEGFNQWKKETEKNLRANYVLDTKEKELKNGNRLYYFCHRSYFPSVIVNRKRNIKGCGSNKIARACPSRLIVVKREGKISVTFYPDHVGHMCEVGRLRISGDDRNKIAGKLSHGVAIERVLQDVREDACVKSIDRIHLLERKDIHNIKRDFSIGYSTRRHENDAVSVKVWVETMKKMEENPVLYFKEQGKTDKYFKEDNFILIVMTAFQSKLLSVLGKSKICIDGTHGLNNYGFQLYIIMMVDEFGSGIPAAFCFSNRADIILFEVYFKCIKDKVGLIKTDTFMSDDYSAFYTAWKSVMTPASKTLLCTWHVKKNWLQNSNKITVADKRYLVLKTLHILHKELNEEVFENGMRNFITQLKSDPDTNKFGEYFIKTYVSRADMWAYCYRKHVGINTNMYLESLHKTIKHIYLEGKKCKRLDKSINALINLIRDKMFDRIIKFSKHKVTGKIQKIRKSHSVSLNILDDFIKESQNPGEWIVGSSKDFNHAYIVQKIFDECKYAMCELKCNICKICVHMFKCSCPDNVINYICKHIHCICRCFFKEIKPIGFESKESLFSETNFEQCISTFDHKDTISSKLDILLGLNKRTTLEEKDHMYISKQLDKLINIYNKKDKNVNLKILDEVNVQQNVEKQIRFVPKKKNKKTAQFPEIGTVEEEIIKKSLMQKDENVLNIHSGFDHTYC